MNNPVTRTRWHDNDVPFCPRFGDFYYSREDGRAETAHVFIGGNRLRERWPAMKACVIGELGFGTGLNFLETVRRWRELAPAGARLEFVSFERHPLDADDMARALARWPELAEQAARLAGLWNDEPPMLDTAFAPDVRLTVHFGDANEILSGLNLTADAWYLDGFAPAKNPQLWGSDLMKAVFAATRARGTFATYTAAGWVRRNLQAAGFEVTRQPGFAGKRQMMVGVKAA